MGIHAPYKIKHNEDADLQGENDMRRILPTPAAAPHTNEAPGPRMCPKALRMQKKSYGKACSL